MRYPKDLQWWPIEILRALGDLADEMPGIDNGNNVYDLLVVGKMKRIKNNSSAEIQLSDIEFVRGRVRAGEEKGKQNMVDATMDDDVHPADDIDEFDAAIEPGVTSGATLLPNATNALPPAILPSED
ncbi:uncharacterized protein J4E78_010604 [Alternaria triticimaculans]|uniref:uncharacterized protein n=1 Tax=Alternaria triticimaculans TaxID=297637 RepID=UPI0020C29E4F|nr:uncharacterized protein J4E78_010604 [Alternaria triticimaculans]KAI4640581.1 hypothetical protein J4E78_010604 [Alternaria triticimaculans]